MTTKKKTRKTKAPKKKVTKSTPPPEEKRHTEETPKTPDPEEKTPAKEPPKAEASPAEKQRTLTYVATLIEGSTYTVRGFTFQRNRPVPLKDPRLIAAAKSNSRFKVELV